MTRPVLLIGLDGATFDVLDPLMAEGHMPVLQRLLGRGVRATLTSTVPALTPPAWTSLVTGRGPGAHGIFDFFRKDTATGTSIRFLTSRDVECPSIWSIATEAGLSSTVLNFPMTFPAPKIRGHVVPGGFMPWRQLRLGCFPEGLFDRLRAVPSFNPRELALDMTHEAKAIEGCADEEYEACIDMHIRRERQWVDIARFLHADAPAEFTAVLFDGTDKLQHLCWRFIDPAAGEPASAWERRVRDKCREYYRKLDGLIGELCDAIPDATTFVTSDHGFGAQERTLFVNSWLAQAGWLTWRDGQAPATDGAASLGLNQLTRHVYQIDWERTRAYAPLPSGNGIHIVQQDAEHPGGVPAGEYRRFRAELSERLLGIADPVTGERVIARVWPREDLFRGPHFDLAPDLTVELTDGGLISILASEAAVQRRPHVSGTHRPDGIFGAAGPEVRQGVRVDRLSILDVAPLMLHSLGLTVPDALEGRFAREVLDPAALAVRPPQYSGDEVAALPTIDDGLDAEAEAEIMSRLQALGYVD